MSRPRIQFPSSNGGVCAGRVRTAYDRSSVLGFAPFCTACVPHCSLAATTTSHYGSGKLQTTETSKQCPLLAGCGHQHFESGEGRLWYSTSPGSIWLRQYPSNDDQGAFSLFSDILFVFMYNQDSMANRSDYVELGLACAEVCKALDRGMNGRRMDELSQPVFEAIEQLTT